MKPPINHKKSKEYTALIILWHWVTIRKVSIYNQ